MDGKYSRVGSGNDLFNHVKSLGRILCPEKNAYSKYEEILNLCKKQSRTKLFLVSLGPTSKLLTYDLFNTGYRVIDIGHVDIEYEWYLHKAMKKRR